MKIELAWPRTEHKDIVPIFLPFMGCKTRCVFCAQDRQTGMNHVQGLKDLRERLHKAKSLLADFKVKHKHKAELAFYGGTFTALPDEEWKSCLDYIEEARTLELVSTFRCSTRPDALKESRLAELRALGCKTVELGVQTFNDIALEKAGRGYSREEALNACRKLKKLGFILGIQLLPGMPGVSPDIFIEDVAQACMLQADLLRFYPCLVLEGTGLAKLWREGKYQVWTEEQTSAYLAKAWNMARKAKIAVSRMSLAPDKSLLKNILAGPYHPCLGSRIQALALYTAITEKIKNISDFIVIKQIYLPRYSQGFFWGFNGELKAGWQELGLAKENVAYWDKDYIEVEI